MFAKIAICDPVCIQSFGHNLNAQSYYRNYLKVFCELPICIGSKHLDQAVAAGHEIHRSFSHVYNRDIPVLDKVDDPLFGSADVSRDATRLLREDLLEILSTFSIGAGDALFFPSVDFWSIRALGHMGDELLARGNPAIFLRFIGVMESADQGCFLDAMAEVVRCVRVMLAEGLDLRISAETPAYAKHLSELLGVRVLTTPYPEVGEMLPATPESEIFRVACPGSARGDKGYFVLRDIFANVRLHDPEQRIRFLLQRLPERDNVHHLKYLSQLYAVPGVSILPSVLDKADIDRIYLESDLIVLPYEAHIYKLRGSAVTMESIAYGRPLLALEGTAFAEQISDYGAGQVCADIPAMVDAILNFSRTPKSTLQENCIRARRDFFIDVNASYQEWLAA